MSFTIIAALDEKRGIGKAGKLPWNLKGDLKHFRDATVGRFDEGMVNAVIMGRTTWESLPDAVRPMPKRLNIVLTTKPEGFAAVPNVLVAKNLDDALTLAKEYASGETFVIGGAKVYAEAIQHPECTRLLLTEVQGQHDCDAFFPDIPSGFRATERSETATEGSETYQYVTYQKE